MYYSMLTTHLPLGYLPPPIRPTQLAQRLLQQQKYQRLSEETGDVQEIEMEVEENEPEVLELIPSCGIHRVKHPLPCC